MIEVFKIQNVYDSEVTPYLPLNMDERTRGHSKKLLKQSLGKKKLKIRQMSFTNRVVSVWNDLPESVVSAPSIKAFERRLDRHWESQDILYNFEAKITRSRDTGIISDEDLDIEA